jgi:hypothetical protein
MRIYKQFMLANHSLLDRLLLHPRKINTPTNCSEGTNCKQIQSQMHSYLQVLSRTDDARQDHLLKLGPTNLH